jgi:hypothetical protein
MMRVIECSSADDEPLIEIHGASIPVTCVCFAPLCLEALACLNLAAPENVASACDSIHALGQHCGRIEALLQETCVGDACQASISSVKEFYEFASEQLKTFRTALVEKVVAECLSSIQEGSRKTEVEPLTSLLTECDKEGGLSSAKQDSVYQFLVTAAEGKAFVMAVQRCVQSFANYDVLAERLKLKPEQRASLHDQYVPLRTCFNVLTVLQSLHRPLKDGDTRDGLKAACRQRFNASDLPASVHRLIS